MKNKKLYSLICFMLIMGAFIPVISMVSAEKPDKEPLEKIIFIHYKKGYGKPPGTPGKGPDKDNGDDEGQYKLLGAKWKTLPVTYVIDPRNSGLEEDFVVFAISSAAEEWDSWTSLELFFDAYEVVYDGSWDDTVEEIDGRNEIVFGDYPDDNVIAVCVIWGYFKGASGKGEIIEFDIMFDTDFAWGDATIDSTVMDLQNIATHELGHGVGLGDLQDSSASEETMYGYAICGEIKKRDLYIGDKAGIKKLYK